ncbi:MAG: vitamin K epoxide reductase family protein [Thermoplasmata archaeon]
MRTRSIRSIIYFAAGLGLIVSIFTYLETVQASLQTLCTVNAVISCAKVDQSGKTTLFGIQDSYIGIAGFVLIFLVAALAESRRKERFWPYFLLFVTTAGVALSFYFGYVEIVEINALCPVCLTAYVFGFVAWFGAIALVLKLRAKERLRATERPEDAPSADAPTSAAEKG